MVPIYVINSWFSLVFKREGWFLFVDLFRDWYIHFFSFANTHSYEAYMIYIFFKYCVQLLGGLEATEILMAAKAKQKCLVPLCCIKFQPNRSFYKRCLQGCVQYVILKPTMTLTSLILFVFGKFEEGDFDPKKGYLYVSIVNNCSVMVRTQNY